MRYDLLLMPFFLPFQILKLRGRDLKSDKIAGNFPPLSSLFRHKKKLFSAKRWKGCKTSTSQAQLANQDSQVGRSWGRVLVNALEITVEQRPIALQMFLHGQDNHPKRLPQNELFSPCNCVPHGTTAWHMPYSPYICFLLMPRLLWYINGNHGKHLRSRQAILRGFQKDRPKNSPKASTFGH